MSKNYLEIVGTHVPTTEDFKKEKERKGKLVPIHLLSLYFSCSVCSLSGQHILGKTYSTLSSFGAVSGDSDRVLLSEVPYLGPAPRGAADRVRGQVGELS